MKFEIKHRFTGTVLFALECDSLKLCLQAAVKAKTDLRDAYVRAADLRDADLCGADLCGVEKATDEQAIANLDKVREIILDDAARLEMDHWHGDHEWTRRSCAEEAVCGTTHCLAGWLQVCATDDKVRSMETQLAGILQAPIASKMFFRKSAEVLDWLKDRKYVVEIEVGNKRHAELSYDTSDDLAAAKKMLETVERMIADDDPEAASQHCSTLAHAVNDLHNAILRSWEDRDVGPSDEAEARAADYRARVHAVQGELA